MCIVWIVIADWLVLNVIAINSVYLFVISKNFRLTGVILPGIWENSCLCHKSSFTDSELYFGDIMDVDILPRWCFLYLMITDWCYFLSVFVSIVLSSPRHAELVPSTSYWLHSSGYYIRYFEQQLSRCSDFWYLPRVIGFRFQGLNFSSVDMPYLLELVLFLLSWPLFIELSHFNH